MKKLAGIVLVLTTLVLIGLVPVSAQVGTSYYVNVASAKLRESPSTKAKVLEKLKRDTQVIVTEVVEGTSVSGSTVWYKVSTGKSEGYIHSSLVTDVAPVKPVAVAPAAAAPANTGRPRNCDEARAWGLTAQQAGQWSHLDRDGDGVACYGD